jgi:folate-binding protein YgfZ
VALEEGRAYAELDQLSLTLVSGGDARAWLHDVVTTDVASLARFETRPSLLLTPTGRIRAAFHVFGLGPRDFLLAQPAGQPEQVDEALAPYILSSDVHLSPTPLRVIALPGRDEPPDWAGRAWRPSILGGGVDLLIAASDPPAMDDFHARLADLELEPADAPAVEARRIHRGAPRFPTDLGSDALPAEAGWDAAPVTDRTKGCFLGQESVAKVANLGHPPRVVLPVWGEGRLQAGTPVFAGKAEVGTVTSADGRAGFARVRWEAREAPLVAGGGGALRRR